MEKQGSVSAANLARQIGVAYGVVVKDINRGILSAEWTGSAWAIPYDEDCQKYIDYRKTILQSITASEMSRRTGQSKDNIAKIVRNGDLVALRQSSSRHGTWYIREEDAKVYCHRVGWEYYTDGVQPFSAVNVPLNGHISSISPTGTPDQCGSCSTEKGNILGDVDTSSHERYGYLCVRCYRLVREFHGDTHRMRKALSYIEKTRGTIHLT